MRENEGLLCVPGCKPSNESPPLVMQIVQEMVSRRGERVTDFIRISDKVGKEYYHNMMHFFDTAALSAEDIIMINDMIVEAGIEVCFNRNTESGRGAKPVMKCSECSIEYKCTKRAYDCPFYMDGYLVILNGKGSVDGVSE